MQDIIKKFKFKNNGLFLMHRQDKRENFPNLVLKQDLTKKQKAQTLWFRCIGVFLCVQGIMIVRMQF
jgi:hypothetical protein